jgi:acetolactate synthase-1/2/3 large subunit
MGAFDMADPLSLGFIGRNGAYPANEAGRRADLVIAIGARFDDRSASSWLPGFSWNFPHTKLIHVDVDADELGRNYPPDLGILADARTFLRQLLAEIELRAAKIGPLPNPPPLAREGRVGGVARRHRQVARRMGQVRRAEF